MPKKKPAAPRALAPADSLGLSILAGAWRATAARDRGKPVDREAHRFDLCAAFKADLLARGAEDTVPVAWPRFVAWLSGLRRRVETGEEPLSSEWMARITEAIPGLEGIGRAFYAEAAAAAGRVALTRDEGHDLLGTWFLNAGPEPLLFFVGEDGRAHLDKLLVRNRLRCHRSKAAPVLRLSVDLEGRPAPDPEVELRRQHIRNAVETIRRAHRGRREEKAVAAILAAAMGEAPPAAYSADGRVKDQALARCFATDRGTIGELRPRVLEEARRLLK